MDRRDHKALALWASECTEHVLDVFDAHRRDDSRPAVAIDAAQKWARGQLSVGAARAAAVDAHAAARACTDPAARAAARAAGHAAAVAHMPGHARVASRYAVMAVAMRDAERPAQVTLLSGSEVDGAGSREADWQYQQLPERLRGKLFPERSVG
jgi:hypothetical protein